MTLGLWNIDIIQLNLRSNFDLEKGKLALLEINGSQAYRRE